MICDPICNVSVCLWDQGDCGDIFSKLLAFNGLDEHVDDTLSNKVWTTITKDAAHEAMTAGVTLGVFLTLGACCVACCLRRYKKKMVKKPASAYMSYGANEDNRGEVGSADTEMAGAA